MAELLLELHSEELPASMQIRAVYDMESYIKDEFRCAGIGFSTIKVYSTPRRIALVVDGLSAKQQDNVVEKRGPRVDAPEKAIEGFLRATGNTIDELEKRKTPKGEFYFAVTKQQGGDTASQLKDIIYSVLCKFVWPKSMRWNKYDIRWARPLHNILCLFDGAVLPLTFGHLTSNNQTFGHRFLAPKPFEVKNFKDYHEQLHKNYVMLNHHDRRDKIAKDMSNIAQSMSLQVKDDPDLLNEVTGLVEWPVVLCGTIDAKFLDLPSEVLSTTMKNHQKYFSMLTNQQKISSRFIMVSNMESEDKGEQIVLGNERVLKARLEDAKFFWDHDAAIKLEDRLDEQQHIIFHAKLGTLADKTARLVALAKLFAVWIPHANLVLVEKAANLSKADLTTLMVGELPELQGVMGQYYAIAAGEDSEVAQALAEHYKPVGPSDQCPSAPLSIAVALADKIDTLVGLFSVDEKPTGSRDPYALRRAALGVIRIILENNLRTPLKLMFEKAISRYPVALYKPEKGTKKLLGGGKVEKVKEKQQRIQRELLDFFIERLRVLLRDQNVRADLINAVFGGGDEDDLVRMVLRIKALQSFLETEDGKNLSAAYKRATNIVVAEEKKDGVTYQGFPRKDLLEKDNERVLFTLFKETKPIVVKNTKQGNFAEAMADLSKLRVPIDQFFYDVKVNVPNADLRRNRLLLLAQFRELLDEVANFTLIEI